MCGITGLVGARAGDRALLEQMTRTLEHRGPDDEGYAHDSVAALGMRRLSIIDVAHGQQPYTDESGSIQVVFNGEIYNHHELRTSLLAAGHVLASGADGEVIAHLYEDDPDGFMHQLDGMFAIAIVDRQRGRLVLVRDRWGKKPLLYAQAGSTLAFASEMRALLCCPFIDRAEDEDAIEAYLTLGYMPQATTALRSVRKVPPGHVLHADLDLSTVTCTPWWQPRIEPDASLTMDEAVARTEELLLAAVRKRLESERPLGVFLSGGVDSSLIAAAAVRTSSGPVHTFSIGFADPAFDETAHAEQVARVLGTRHTTYRADELLGDVIASLPQVLDQPFADSSTVPTLLLAQMARAQAVVALGGDGGDELFGGYVRYRAAPALQRAQGVPGLFALARAARPVTARVLGARRSTRLHDALTSHSSLLSRYLEVMALDPSAPSRAAAAAFADAWRQQPGLDLRLRPRLVDLMTYLPDDILLKGDLATMAASLELRSPLLDRDVTDFALTLPEPLLLSDGGKPVLKRLARQWIPGFDADRPKMGFGIPLPLLLAGAGAQLPGATPAQQWAQLRLDQWRATWLASGGADARR
ncbi:MAG: asparagine synthase (glutamine-hydrolyzing) [Candidatus Nanopelagicales bacterium]|nr:asparagine synthase (glutamine-hydrolyzing) [Candidatus Nanopelagicales bacterium]